MHNARPGVDTCTLHNENGSAPGLSVAFDRRNGGAHFLETGHKSCALRRVELRRELREPRPQLLATQVDDTLLLVPCLRKLTPHHDYGLHPWCACAEAAFQRQLNPFRA